MKDARSIKAVHEAMSGLVSKETADAAYANRKQTADICRKLIPIEIWNI
jgi:hypothetical protein